jgi:predicted hydrolase (HD superfamily)
MDELSERQIKELDIDWYCLIQGKPVHIASSGGMIPEQFRDLKELRFKQDRVANMEPIAEAKLNIENIQTQIQEGYEYLQDEMISGLYVYLPRQNGFDRKNMENHISRKAAIELLKKYNKDPFHLRHALTVEAVMRWFARELGYAEEEEFWGLVGLLHDIDFEMYPEEHCIKAPELLREAGVGEKMIHAICSHAYGMHVDVKPEHLMEKVLFATDELTGLIWATALMRPSKSVQDMELKSLKKKYKVKTFAAGCSREVIEQGAEMLGWPLDEVQQKTLDAMKAGEEAIAEECAKL